MLKKTKLIVFEGTEGAGKTTQIKLLSKYLEKLGYSCLSLREPGGSKLAEGLRSIVLSSDYDTSVGIDTLLFIASRADNVSSNILPNMGKVDFILCDRFLLSTLIYQGILGGLGIENIYYLHKNFNFDISPDLTIVFSVNFNTSLSRLSSRLQNNKIDKKDNSFHKDLIRYFDNCEDFYKYPVKKIDANLTISDIQANIQKIIQDIL